MRSGTNQSTTEATYTSLTAKEQLFGSPQDVVPVRPPSSHAQEVLHAAVLHVVVLVADAVQTVAVKHAEESYALAVPASERYASAVVARAVGQTVAVRIAATKHADDLADDPVEDVRAADPEVVAVTVDIATHGFEPAVVAKVAERDAKVGYVVEHLFHEGFGETVKAIASPKAVPVDEAVEKRR